METRFILDTDRREVDFVVMKDGDPVFAVECKSSARDISPAIRCMSERTPIPRYCQVQLGQAHFQRGSVTIMPFRLSCTEPGMP